LELRLDTGYVGYWLFLAFVLASLHVLERVRRIDYVRALGTSFFVQLRNYDELDQVGTDGNDSRLAAISHRCGESTTVCVLITPQRHACTELERVSCPRKPYARVRKTLALSRKSI
jgi:hypothetical protein